MIANLYSVGIYPEKLINLLDSDGEKENAESSQLPHINNQALLEETPSM